MTRTATRRHAVVAAATVAAVTALSGCSQPVPSVRPVEVTEPVPVVTSGQLDRVVEQVDAALVAADAANDAERLGPRVEGAAQQIRAARYAVRETVPTQPAPTPLGTERLLDIVPTDGQWPRFVLTITEPTPGAVPELAVLTQQDPHDPYSLTATSTLLPGVTVPQTAAAESGVAEVGPTEESGLLMSPAQALARYASVLTSGADSPDAAAFAPDAFQAAVVAEQDAERTAATTTCPGCFEYDVTHTPREGALWAVRTEDGGALVVGVLDTRRTFTVADPGAKLPISADLAALAGKTVATSTADIRSVEVVAMHVPPADGDDQVTVLAAERAPLTVAAS